MRRSRSPARAGLAALLLFAACGSDPLEDPRQWSETRLMQGAQRIAPSADSRFNLLFVAGEPYQMGYQQGRLLGNAFKGLRDSGDLILMTALDTALHKGPGADEGGETYAQRAMAEADPRVVAECEGLAAAVGDAVVTAEECVTLSSAEWLLDDLVPRYFPGVADMLRCSELIAAGSATTTGQLIHGRNLDWLALGFMMENPTLAVRAPSNGLRHVTVAWPGMIGVLTGINEAGIAVGTDDISCKPEHRRLAGRDAMQLMLAILTDAHTLEEAEALIAQTPHGSCELVIVSHGSSRQALVAERSGSAVRFRRMGSNDVLFATNHYLHPEMVDQQTLADVRDLTDASVTRYTRLSERLVGYSLPPHANLEAGSPDLARGRIDVPLTIDILRDPVDLRPDQDRRSFPCTVYTGGGYALGNNHNVHSVVFVPEAQQMWVTAGWDAECKNPIYGSYVGFDLQQLFAGRYDPMALPSYDPPYNGSYGNGVHEL